jgi:hypothetical protein
MSPKLWVMTESVGGNELAPGHATLPFSQLWPSSHQYRNLPYFTFQNNQDWCSRNLPVFSLLPCAEWGLNFICRCLPEERAAFLPFRAAQENAEKRKEAQGLGLPFFLLSLKNLEILKNLFSSAPHFPHL